jgi:hypothetical protein
METTTVMVVFPVVDNKMKNILVIALIAFVLFAGYAHASDDTQFWNRYDFKFKLNETWKLSFNEEIRYSDKASRLIYYHHDIGLSTEKIIEGVEIGINYRLVNARSSDKDWKQINSPHVNFTFKNILDLPLSNRSRFQFLDNEKEFDDFWIYRNQTTVKLDQLFEIKNLKPYVSDEFFIRMDGPTEINRNRLSFGLSYKIKSVDIKCFYMWQTTNAYDEWIDVDVVGLNVGFKF